MKNLQSGMSVFISGVMQGTRSDNKVHHQHYRQNIAQVLQENLEDVKIIDPWVIFPTEEINDDEQARAALIGESMLAGKADALVAYLPEASMGSAVEIWEAHRAGVPIFSISPLADNWVVKLFSARVFPTLEAFKSFITAGGLTPALQVA